MAGAMGAGKGHVLTWLSDHALFPLASFVRVDTDALRALLPETEGYMARLADAAGALTQREANSMSEILTLHALAHGQNVLIDGSLRDAAWHQTYMQRLRTAYPRTRLAIFHVHATDATVLRRARARAVISGRNPPEALIRTTLALIPLSVKRLSPLVEVVASFANEHADPDVITLRINPMVRCRVTLCFRIRLSVVTQVFGFQ